MSVLCEVAAPFVANSAVDEVEIVAVFRPHTDSCLRCQARHAAMSKTARELTAIGDLKSRGSGRSRVEGDGIAGRRSRCGSILEKVRSQLTGSVAYQWASAVVIWRLRPRAS